MSEIQPPILTEHGKAPAAVCARWIGDSPCGAAATAHVIWDSTATANAAVCKRHEGEIRERWVYAGLHPYDAACAAAGLGATDVCWFAHEDRCARVCSAHQEASR